MRIFKPYRPILGVIAAIFVFGLSAYGQQPCPTGLVCITPAAARKALEDSDRRTALEAEVKVKDQAIADYKDELNKMRIEFAGTNGQLIMCKENAVSDRAIIDILIRNTKARNKYGIINF